MKLRFGIILILLVVLVSACSTSGIKGSGETETGIETVIEKKDTYDRSEFVLGTIVSIRLFEDGSEAILNDVFKRLEEIELKMTFNSDSSEIIEINKNAGIGPVKVSEDTYAVISAALDYAKKSDGAFDPTIGPLVKLWAIGSDYAKVPADLDRLEAVDLTHYSGVLMDKDHYTVHLSQSKMMLDLGAIAKGYASDEVVRILQENHISRAIINLGGNVYAYGEKADQQAWKIGIQNPFSIRGEYIGIVSLKNKSVVTSGIYERYFEEDGVKYHHLLNTSTGYPIENELASVTIISENSMQADALSTVLFALGVEKGTAFVKTHYPEISVVFITKEKKVFTTQMDSLTVEWTDNTFEVQ